jgi:hypothetical protein
MVDQKQSNEATIRAEKPTDLPVPRSVSHAGLASIISRIEQAVEEETVAIRTDTSFDLKASNARKTRYLYELSRAVKNAGSTELPDEQREAIMRLREKLARNEAAILAHLSAVNEVATLIQGAIQRGEADGTYSAGEFGRR